MANYLSRSDQKVHLIFQNYAPRGTKVSCSNGFKRKGSVYRDGFITNSNHQFFQDPKSNIWTTFSFFFIWLYDHEIYSFLETSARFIMTRVSETQVDFIHMLTSKQCLYFSKSTFTSAKILEQKTKRLPLVDPLS